MSEGDVWSTRGPGCGMVEYGPITGFTHVTPVLPEADLQAVKGRVSRRLALDANGLVGRIQAGRIALAVGSDFPN